ncbi:hypothetical protein NM208_g15288 [Fusarium decemcellulare]|uniref:Uncharacterized protein n=1 Tax=Fusarium decemcellulare TaxID=57161 RepID=A0ACC1RG16_9HYPO|nr:hypothetical protein NM208_g15288 [Fusarium decemcellulare]
MRNQRVDTLSPRSSSEEQDNCRIFLDEYAFANPFHNTTLQLPQPPARPGPISFSLTCSSVAYKSHMSETMINGRKRFRAVEENFTKSFQTNLQVALSDFSGDSLATEYLEHGKLMCYHNQNYTVIAGGAYHLNKGYMYDEIWHGTQLEESS